MHDLTSEEKIEVLQSAVSILLKKLEMHEMKLNLLAENVVILKDQKLQMLNSPN